MHIAVIHGYLLQGTGSNLYVQNLCRELCRLGHSVSLFCQERAPEELDFISKVVEFSSDNQGQIVVLKQETNYPGKCTCYRPHLGGLLPVYVYDRYEGYQVKEFTKLTKHEIEVYLDRNSIALATCFTEHPPDLILSNHTIMQPVYAARACRGLTLYPHFMTVHGSAFNFSVRKSDLLKEYALQAATAADRIIFVSNFSRQEFLKFFGNDAIAKKTCLIPAGVDVDKFTPLSRNAEKSNRLSRLIKLPEQKLRTVGGRTAQEKKDFSQAVAKVRNSADLRPLLDNLRQKPDSQAPDRDTPKKLANIDWSKDHIILYYGKYLWTKGIQLLIAAAPLVWHKHPDAYFIFVGFGSFRGYLEALVAALEHNRRDIFCNMITYPSRFDSEVEQYSSIYFAGLLEKLRYQTFADRFFATAHQLIAKRVIFTGFMTHDYLKDLIPCSDVTVATSIFPEAFGMVAVEALASGVIPMQTNFSGFTDVIHDYVREFRDTFDAMKLKRLLLNEQLVLNIANNIGIFLDYYEKMSKEERQDIRRRAQMICVNKYSWRTMALHYLSLCKNATTCRYKKD